MEDRGWGPWAGRPGPHGLERVPAPRPPLELSLDSFLSCLSSLSLESGTQVTAAAPELWCRREAGWGSPRASAALWGLRGRRGGEGAPRGAPSLPGRCLRPATSAAAPLLKLSQQTGGNPPRRGGSHASPSVPWGRSLTGSAAGAPTLAAAIHPGRRSCRTRRGRTGGGKGGPGARDWRGGEGVATPQRLSRPCPTPPPASSPLLSALLPALDPPKFFWCLILHSLLSSSSFGVSSPQVGGEGAPCSRSGAGWGQVWELRLDAPGSRRLGPLAGLKPPSPSRTLSFLGGGVMGGDTGGAAGG